MGYITDNIQFVPHERRGDQLADARVGSAVGMNSVFSQAIQRRRAFSMEMACWFGSLLAHRATPLMHCLVSPNFGACWRAALVSFIDELSVGMCGFAR